MCPVLIRVRGTGRLAPFPPPVDCTRRPSPDEARRQPAPTAGL